MCHSFHRDPFKSTPSFHVNRIEELEDDKHVEEVVNKHEMYKLDNDPQCLDEVIRNYLATHKPHVEPVESYCEDKCDNDERLLQEKFEDEFFKLCEKTSVEEQKISSTHMEKMEHTNQNCEGAYIVSTPRGGMNRYMANLMTINAELKLNCNTLSATKGCSRILVKGSGLTPLNSSK